MPSGTISLLRVGTNSAPINSEKSTTELNGPHFSEFGRPNLTLDLEIHVINIIMWIRDTGCYNPPPENKISSRDLKGERFKRDSEQSHVPSLR
jgi:hypothetical protein